VFGRSSPSRSEPSSRPLGPCRWRSRQCRARVGWCPLKPAQRRVALSRATVLEGARKPVQAAHGPGVPKKDVRFRPPPRATRASLRLQAGDARAPAARLRAAEDALPAAPIRSLSSSSPSPHGGAIQSRIPGTPGTERMAALLAQPPCLVRPRRLLLDNRTTARPGLERKPACLWVCTEQGQLRG